MITRRRVAGQWLVFVALILLAIGGMVALANEVFQPCACTTVPAAGDVAPG